MTKEETLRVLAILKAAYPNSYSGMSKREAAGTVTVWAVQFANISVDVVLMAVQKLISTNKFPPTISEVKNKLSSIAWEAYEELRPGVGKEELPADMKQLYQRIYEETKGYKYCKEAEPTLHQMICGSQHLQLAEPKEY